VGGALAKEQLKNTAHRYGLAIAFSGSERPEVFARVIKNGKPMLRDSTATGGGR
jgi:hypothetical protein